jgi:hypothetical protein
MAIVKANFVRRGKGAKGKAKASIRYIQNRRGKEGEKLTRTLFGPDGPTSRDEAYRMIDESDEKSLFYRFVFSPDPKKEDTGRDLDMRDLTVHTMQALEERVGESIVWVAAVHADHAPHRHIHIVAVLPKRLFVKDFQRLRGRAGQACREQRRFLDHGQNQKRERLYQVPSFVKTRPSSRSKDWTVSYGGSAGLNPSLHRCTCPGCSTTRVHSNRDPVHKCSSCGIVLHKPLELFPARKEFGWGR